MSNAVVPSVVVLSQRPEVTGHDYFIDPGKLISGNPRQSVWLQYETPSSEFAVGIWSSEAGEWRIHYTEEEYCHILEGRSVITDATGHAVTVVAGDEFTIPAGFIGTWRVEAPTRKRFVIYERPRGG